MDFPFGHVGAKKANIEFPHLVSFSFEFWEFFASDLFEQAGDIEFDEFIVSFLGGVVFCGFEGMEAEAADTGELELLFDEDCKEEDLVCHVEGGMLGGS